MYREKFTLNCRRGPKPRWSLTRRPEASPPRFLLLKLIGRARKCAVESVVAGALSEFIRRRGNITLTNAPSSSARVVSSSQERTVPLTQPSNMPTQNSVPSYQRLQRPRGRERLAPVAPGPEEISEGDILRVDTELVSVNVSVVDRGTSRGVNDLTKDDFRLYEDNAQQQIAHFESASGPFNLILLIDLSGSTTKVVELIKAAALHFVEAARPFDRIAVITFAGGQVVVSPLTSDHNALRQRISAHSTPRGQHQVI